jgi:hypothetical protein
MKKPIKEYRQAIKKGLFFLQSFLLYRILVLIKGFCAPKNQLNFLARAL